MTIQAIKTLDTLIYKSKRLCDIYSDYSKSTELDDLNRNIIKGTANILNSIALDCETLKNELLKMIINK